VNQRTEERQTSIKHGFTRFNNYYRSIAQLFTIRQNAKEQIINTGRNNASDSC